MNARNFAPIPPLPQRTLRIAVLALQSAVVATVLILGLIGVSTPMRDRVFALLSSGSHPGPAPIVAVLCLAWVLAAAAAFLAAWRLQSRSSPSDNYTSRRIASPKNVTGCLTDDVTEEGFKGRERSFLPSGTKILKGSGWRGGAGGRRGESPAFPPPLGLSSCRRFAGDL